MKKSRPFFSGHRRWLSILMVFALIMAMMPGMAFAEMVPLEGGNTESNPSYTVEYYGNVTMLAASAGNEKSLTFIDTSKLGDNELPVNGVGYNYTGDEKYNDRDSVDIGKTLSNGQFAEKKIALVGSETAKKIKTEKSLTQIYKSKQFEYISAPNLTTMDQVSQQGGHYNLVQMVVTYPDGQVKTYGEAELGKGLLNVRFTNATPSADKPYEIQIKEGTKIRLIYDENTSPVVNDVTMFDYNITDGTTTTVNGKTYVNSYKQGINSDGNYSGTGVKYAFGNANTATADKHDVYDASWNGQYLNRYNAKWYPEKEYRTIWLSRANASVGCTFGLVNGINLQNFTPEFSPGLIVPDIFSANAATGKILVDNVAGDYVATFNRTGDTYSLTSVGSKDGTSGVSDLETFKLAAGLWSNDFWPLDSESYINTVKNSGIKIDPKFGGITKIGYSQETGENLPDSDNGVPHNNYFGMKYQVQFKLDAEYVGPLEYLFYGDDDMWVFLTDSKGNSKMIADIGGVHSSAGEYVDLWKHIAGGKNNHVSDTYTLSVFYTERGASGSTCYMQFTLPSVVQSLQDIPTGNLKITKDANVTGKIAITEEENEEFDFNLTLTDAADNALTDKYYYAYYDKNGNKTSEGLITEGTSSETEIHLKAGEYITIHNLPTGTKYKVTEFTENDPEYDVTYNNCEGTIGSGNATSVATVTNTYKTGDLIVKKTLTGTGADELAAAGLDYTFTVTLDDATINGTYGKMEFEDGVATFTLRGGESKKAEDLPDGIGYTVTEAACDGETYGKYAAYIQAGPMVEGIIEYDQETHKATEKIAEITNTYNTGTLAVTKTVTGEAATAGEKFDFTVELSDKTINGTYGEMEFKEGVATFQLGNGKTVEATGLPSGISYSVVEADCEYSVTAVNASGTIPFTATDTDTDTDTEKAIAEFTNYRGPANVTLTAKKFFDSNAPKDKVFTFELQKKEADGTYETIQTKQNDAEGNITFDAMQFKTTGTYEYKIIEKDDNQSGIIYDSSEYLVTITVDEKLNDDTKAFNTSVTYKTKYGTAYTGVPTFNNWTPVPTTSVRVNKVWNDNNDAAGKRPDSITVQLLKNGVVEKTETLSVSNNWRTRWDGLNNGYTWTVSEAGVPTDYNVFVSGNGTSSVTITNTYVAPEEPIVTPEDPTVPTGDKEVDDPTLDLNDSDVPADYMEVGDPDVPKTDDGSNVNIWLLIALLSGAALIASVAAERRRDKHSA